MGDCLEFIGRRDVMILIRCEPDNVAGPRGPGRVVLLQGSQTFLPRKRGVFERKLGNRVMEDEPHNVEIVAVDQGIWISGKDRTTLISRKCAEFAML